jgi:hypothetical protein
VVTVKLALVAPAGTVTVAGTEAIVERLLDRATIAPPDGAAPLKVTVAVVLLPPPTVGEVGVKDASVTDGCNTVRVAFRGIPPKVAVMVTDWVEVT